MKETTFALLALVVLITQPLIITAGLTFDSVSAAEGVVPTVLAQEPGTRLTSSELTNHIPVFINGSDDFVSQGWPGAGTEGAPYVISGLNITYDIGDPCIWILNTDQYFVIRDCYIGGLSSVPAISFYNTEHAAVEYTTVRSQDTGVYAFNSPNTEISSADIVARGSSRYAVYFDESDSSSIQTSQLYSADWRCVIVYNSSYCSTNNNQIEAVYHKYGIYVYMSRHFGSTGDTVEEGHSGIRIESSNDTVVEEMDMNTQYGVNLYDAHGADISKCKIDAYNYDGVYVALSDDISIEDSSINAQSMGIDFYQSDNSIADSNVINDTSSYGIGLSSSQNNVITGNTISYSSGAGVYLSYSNDTQVLSNSISDIDGFGIQADTSHRLNVSTNTISRVTADGFSVSDSDNGTFHGNDVSYATSGASLDNCYAWEIDSNTMHDMVTGIIVTGSSHDDIWNNDISKASDAGIEAEDHGVIEIWENIISESNAGIFLLSCNDQYIRDNTVTMCEVAGLLIRETVDSEISMNTISDCAQAGISLEDFNASKLIGNDISRCPFAGILYQSGNYSTFQDNNLVDCGLFLFAQLPILSPAVSDYNHSISGNTVNGKPLYYAINQSALSINGNSYGEIIVVNCSEVTITGGQFVSSTCALELAFSNNVRITNIECEDLTMPIFGLVCENVTIADSTISGTNEQYGAYLYSFVGTSLENVSFEGLGGALLGDSFALGVSGFYNLSVVDCEFTDIQGIAIAMFPQVSLGSFGVVSGCSFANATYGVLGYMIDNLNITDNEFKWCDTAIYLTNCVTLEITWNNIHDNTEGIYSGGCGDSVIANNTIRWNQIGVDLIEQNSPLVVADNIIALNLIENGADNTFEYWDNGVDSGNWWNDYSGMGAYTVSGVGGAQDRYPKKYVVDMPIINSPKDVWYAEGSTGNQIVWLPFDNELRNWQVKVDGQVWATESWNFQDATVNIDGLAYATHTVVITVWDVDQNSVTDTVMVHVYDDLRPVIKSPANQWLFVDATGQTINWQVGDRNPATYTLAVDGNDFASGTWMNGTLGVNVDGINDVGQHTLVLTIYDMDGNSAQGTVLVKVIDDNVSPTIEQPDAVTYIEGTTGNSIAWTASDEYPASFTVESNSSTVTSGSWGGSRIVLNVDGLAPGSYQYTLTIYDMSGNSASSAVNVTVVPLIPPLPAGGIDWVLVAIVGAVAGGAVVLVVAMYYLRKRRT